MKILFAIAFTACGSGVHSDNTPDAPAVASCGTTGTGSVTGTSKGASIGTVERAFAFSLGGMFGIVLDDVLGVNGSCDTARASSSGHYLVMGFCAPIAPGHYDTVAESAFHCPSNPYGLVKGGDTHDWADGLGGTIDIASVDGGCTTGTYALNFDNGGSTGFDTLTGSFSAVMCP